MKNLKYFLPLLLLLSNRPAPSIISCGPPIHSYFRANVISIMNGNWSNPMVWSGGIAPRAGDAVSIGHNITLDQNADISGATVTGTLEYSPDKGLTIQSTKNIIISGTLRMRPASPSVVHLLRFININENNFIGGGEDPMDSDVGLWVMNGKLDLVGSEKTSWANAAGSISAASTSISLRGPPSGWAIGDELMITPTAANDYSSFNVVPIRAVSGSLISTGTVLNSHPIVNNKWTAEVCNLTRNVRIEGTSTGKSHVFIRSSLPQNIQYVQFRYMGPRKDQAAVGDPKGRDGIKEFLLGRYALHFHHGMDGSRGSVVESCVVRDCDSHSYVTHGSHGVYVHNNIAYNVTETPYWWDEGPQHASHDIRWISNIAALVKYVPRSINIEKPDNDPTLSSRGFLLGHGDGNICDSNVAVGTMGDNHDGGGFRWEAVSNSYLEGVWHVLANIAHNCNAGFSTWQNVQLLHLNEDCVAYNNGIGVFHGAYLNVYKYSRFELYNNPFVLHAASSNQARLRVEDLTVDAAGQDYAVIIESNSEVGDPPILIRNLKAINYKKAAVLDSSGQTVHSADIIQTDGKFRMAITANAGEVLRTQNTTGIATQITKNGTASIQPFAPTLWGTGTGLLGEYFNNPDFTSPALTRIDSYIGFSEWYGTQSQIHYAIKYSTYSVRWTGKIQPQFTETYKITASANNGGAKLFIDGKLVTGSLALIAGKLYDIRIEYSKATSVKSGITLFWTCPSLELFIKGGEYVPQSQLYPPDFIPPPPTNKPPVVNAGLDITIQLPSNGTSLGLTGTSTDPDGIIVSYKWSKISGPIQYNLTNSDQAVSQVSSLVAGTYTFRLTVTDDKGARGIDDVVVTVKAAPVNLPPVVNVSVSVTVTKSGVINLSGSGTDPEGGVLTYQWRQSDTGAIRLTIVQDGKGNGSVTNAPTGDYKFILRVTDDKGASSEKEVSVTI